MVIGLSEVMLGEDISPEMRADMLSIKTAGKRQYLPSAAPPKVMIIPSSKRNASQASIS